MQGTVELLREAKHLAESTTTWADLSNALYDPFEGILAKAFPTKEERLEFIASETFRQIQQLLAMSRKRHGLVEGATPTKITEFMTRLPLASRTAVEREASVSS